MSEQIASYGLDRLQPGDNVLLLGEPLSGKQNLAMDTLAAGAANGSASIIVTTKDSADRVREDFATRVDDVDAIKLSVVDCVTEQQGVAPSDPEPWVRYASSPRDLTEIGISLTRFLSDFGEDTRVMVHSISTLLMYAELRTVFQFLHLVTGRIQTAGASGVYTLDLGAHDPQEINTIKPLFDDIVEISGE